MAVRHLGIFRDVTVEEAKLDKAALKALFRRGSMVLGALASYVSRGVDDASFKASLARLVEWGMVELADASYSVSKKALLTPDGAGWAMELCCAERAAERDEAEAKFQENLRKARG